MTAIATKKVLKVTRNTILKREPKQSSDLTAEQMHSVPAGTEMELHSFASTDGDTDLNGHVRVALLNQSINGFNTWYIWGKHIEIEQNGENVYPHEEEAARFVLEITQDTILKRRPVETAQLADNEKTAIAKGMSIELHSYSPKDATGKPFDGHIKFAIADCDEPINGFTTWYISEADAHVELNDELVYPLKKAAPAPASSPAPAPVTAAKPVAEPKPAAKPASSLPAILPAYPAKKIKLPDGRTVCATDSIIPGGGFTWGHATHGGVRVPQSNAHTQNMIKLATEMEKVRKQLGRPIRVTSWYRPEPWNSRVGGARRSTHLSGMGIDIAVTGMPGRTVGNAVSWWKGGLGIYPGNRKHILHLDIGGRRKWGF